MTSRPPPLPTGVEFISETNRYRYTAQRPGHADHVGYTDTAEEAVAILRDYEHTEEPFRRVRRTPRGGIERP